jgi:type IV pilus assembly protein PilY1
MMTSRCLLTWLICSVALGVPAALADDIDIFTGVSGGLADAPNIMFFLDNSSNWSRASQHWPDAPTQGDAELRSISAVLPGISRPANVGLAMFTVAAPSGAYIRFGARDISNAQNVTAFQNILGGINVNSPAEKVNIANKDDSAGLYELYKYFYGLAPYAGSALTNPEADFAPNLSPLTANGQGLTSGFALNAAGLYNSPSSGCSKNYVIFISNNANNTGATGQSTYQPGVASVVPALPPTAVDMWNDEWARYLFRHGIATYVIDVFNAQQNVGYSAALMAVAKQGGGKYYVANNSAQIQSAIKQILDEIQAVSSSFAAANLPASANSRTYDLNQVYIGMFQPDPNAMPRWFGNLKEYQLQVSGGAIDLADANGLAVVNPLTGFVTSCAVSLWTFDTNSYTPPSINTPAPYWSLVPVTPLPLGTCPSTNTYSDLPDGPIVEKGAAAEVLRRGNNPGAAPTWNPSTRSVMTLTPGGAMTPFTTASSGLTAPLVNFLRGYDVNDENSNGLTDGTNGLPAESRPSILGDVLHSQPLAVNYGGTTGVVVYYGANDGMLHAISGSTGKELWGFIVPEFFPRLSRLMTDSPTINYWGTPVGIIPAPTPKDYYFDGSFGLYQDATNTNVWLFPAMRRGGRMLYGLDISNPFSPTVKWRIGCPDLTDNTGCTPGMSGIGQTWSTPRVALVQGYSAAKPVVILGGGYDGCEDANTATPACVTPTGAGVYVLDAATGAVVAQFPTDRSVPADVSLVDVNFDGYVDYAYVADTGGNLYRLSFVNDPSTLVAASPARWSITKIAYTHGAGRKFLYSPALLPNSHMIYLALGSGDREHPMQAQYPYTTPVTNRFYVYLDDPSSTSTNSLDDTTIMADCTLSSSCSMTQVVPGGSLKGWFMSLNRHGTDEQVVSGAVIAGGMIAFGTNRPIPSNIGTCATILGEARGYWVDLLNSAGTIVGGSRSAVFPAGGFPNTPQVQTVQIGDRLYTVVGGAASLNGGASSTIGFQRLTPTISSKRKRVYWYTPIDN